MISIHTTTQVVTSVLPANPIRNGYFNPHHHAGGDLIDDQLMLGDGNFNPHHHAGGDMLILEESHEY